MRHLVYRDGRSPPREHGAYARRHDVIRASIASLVEGGTLRANYRFGAPAAALAGIGCIVGICSATTPPPSTWAEEDGLVETLSAVFWLGGMACAAIAIRRGSFVRFACLWLLLCLVCPGEETSWFQRYLHYSVPAVEQASNQAEFNLHNLAVLPGSVAQQLFMAGMFVYFLVIPGALSRGWWRDARRPHRLPGTPPWRWGSPCGCRSHCRTCPCGGAPRMASRSRGNQGDAGRLLPYCSTCSAWRRGTRAPSGAWPPFPAQRAAAPEFGDLRGRRVTGPGDRPGSPDGRLAREWAPNPDGASGSVAGRACHRI